MTNQDGAQEAAAWEVRWDNHSRWQVITDLSKPSEEGTQSFRLVAECTSHFDANRIIADHRKAAKAEALADALERIANHHHSKLTDGSSNPDWVWDHIMVSEFAAAALADWAEVAATEGPR